MGFIKKLFTKNKSKDEMSAEEKIKLENLLNEKKIIEEDFDEEYVDDISTPQIDLAPSIVEDKNKPNVQSKNFPNTPSEIKTNIKPEHKNENNIHSIEEEEMIIFNKFIDNLNSAQILKMKELLDKKENEFKNKNSFLTKKNKKKELESNSSLDEIKSELEDDDLEGSERSKVNPDIYEIYETSEYGKDAFDEINTDKKSSPMPTKILSQNLNQSKEVLIIEEEDIEKSELELNAVIINKLRDIFSDENLFFKVSKKLSYDILSGDDTTCIGIRKKEAYFNEESIADQNSWFIKQIKTFDSLKNFKVVRSEDGIKDLVWNKEHPVLICFRSINHLPNQDSFKFPEK